MVKNILLAVFLLFILGTEGFSQVEKKNFISFGFTCGGMSSQFYKTDYGQTVESEPSDHLVNITMLGYGRRFSEHLALEVQLAYMKFTKKYGFRFNFNGQDGQTIETGYDIDLRIRDYGLRVSLESNPGFWSFIYFKFGGGAGLNTFKADDDNVNKTIYGLDGDFLRVAKAGALDSKNYYISWFGGFGFYLIKGEIRLKLGFNAYRNTKVDMKFENIEMQNLYNEVYLHLNYYF